jgi:hypothetical protein
MIHLTEEQLVFHYYGEDGETLATERHLEECEQCRALYGSLQRTLNVMGSMPAPERGPDYGAQVWRRIEAKLPARRGWWIWAGGSPALRYRLACATVAVLLTVAFVAGRFYPHRPGTTPMAADTEAPKRILLVAVSDYLERSQMVLIELANANVKGPLDISPEQARAQELIGETRLYRQTAAATGSASVSGILDELERLLLDIAHGPSRLSPAELETFRARLESEGILFKIRIVNSNAQRQDETQAADAPRQRL